MSMQEILDALQAILDGAKQTNEDGAEVERPLNEDEMARYEALEAELKVIQRSAEIVKRNAAYRTNVTKVGFNATEKQGDTYARAFESYLRTGRPNSDLIQRAQGTTPDSAGGFLVPDEWRDKIVEKLLNFGGLMNAAETITTSTGAPLNWITNDETAANLAEITAEQALWSTGADLVFGQRTLGAFKYTTVGATGLPLKVSYELLQDSAFDLRGFISKKFAQRIARKLAVDIVTGVGTTTPQGIVSAAGGIASTTAMAAATGPTFAELLRTIHALDPDYRDGASWLMNDATLAEIRGLVDTAGRPLLWNNSDDLSGSLKGLSLLGYPVVIDQAMPNTAAPSNKAILFGNLRDAYVVRQVKAFEMVVLNELYAQNGQVGFMGWARYDGMVQDANAAIILPAPAV